MTLTDEEDRHLEVIAMCGAGGFVGAGACLIITANLWCGLPMLAGAAMFAACVWLSSWSRESKPKP